MKTSLIASLVTGFSILTFAQASAQEVRDGFYWLDRLNRASLVMLSEQKVLTGEQTDNIAKALDELYEEGKKPDFKRTTSYSSVEPFLIRVGGPEVSRLHTGRSTWDVGAVNRRMLQRESVMNVYSALIEARQSLLAFAKKYPNDIIPAYTGGVQAQPTSLGHFLTAYAEVYGRHADALEQAYRSLNLSPFGAAALGTSSYPINRQRLSDLLGFERPIHNSYDAVLLSAPEVNMRLAGAMASIAITTNQLVEDLGNQYYLSHPWLAIPPNLTSGSTIMPQKLNPDSVNNTRNDINLILGAATTYIFEGHNSESGYFGGGGGGGGGESVDNALQLSAKSLRQIAAMFNTFEFHKDRAMELVLNDYATATELANTLQRVGNIPFRDAHHVAAGIVQFGRSKGLRASEIQFSDFERVFQEVAEQHHMQQKNSGLTEDQFKRALTPSNMVEAAAGLGGPQPSSVTAMIEENAKSIEADKAWLTETRSKLDAASKSLDEAFAKL
jgi:argininosuccinate lyase